jgi:hypothetical protein
MNLCLLSFELGYFIFELKNLSLRVREHTNRSCLLGGGAECCLLMSGRIIFIRLDARRKLSGWCDY